MRTFRCRHPSAERWVTCVHTELITRAVPIRTWVVGTSGGARVSWQIDGEALCPGCHSAVENGRPHGANLRLACGACVREKWPLEGAS